MICVTITNDIKGIFNLGNMYCGESDRHDRRDRRDKVTIKPQLYLAHAACRNAWVSYRLHTFSTGLITLVPSRVSQSLLTPRRPSDFDRRGVGGGGCDASAQSGLV